MRRLLHWKWIPCEKARIAARHIPLLAWSVISHTCLLTILGLSVTPNSVASPRAAGPRKGAELLNEWTLTKPRSDSLDPLAGGSRAPIQIRVGPMSGWAREFTMSNGSVEAHIVPAIGRVMQFRFLGETGPFWEDTALRGQFPALDAEEWANFGGDKAWPAPQADWPRMISREWPPPVGFDATPVTISVRRDALVMTSSIDPHYGIRTERVIELDHRRPMMTITTTYEKLEGQPCNVGIWIITQLNDPVAVFAPISARSLFPDGYQSQSGENLPANLSIRNGLLSLTRDPGRAAKIGLDTDRLLWVGQSHMLLIESSRVAGFEYPDQGSSAEIYTNPDPKTYVELEMLGPLHLLRPGDQIHQTNSYTLIPRKSADPERDARRVLKSRQTTN